MSEELRAGHEGLGNGVGDQPVVGGVGSTGEFSGKYPVGFHRIACGTGKPVCGKLAFIERVKKVFPNAQIV